VETRQRNRVLLTGGTGMIGATLAARLVAEGDRVSVLVREDSSRLRLQSLNGQVHLLFADICDANAVRAAVEQAEPTAVYHLASTPFNPPTMSAQQHLNVIVGGTLNLLEALRDRPGVRMIAAGSAAEYGAGSSLREDHPLTPTTVLGAAKAAATLFLQTYARLYRMQTVILRVFTPYGPWERRSRLVPSTILSALEGRDVLLTNGTQRRDYFYVEDLIDAMVLAATKPIPPGTVLNICAGQSVPIQEIAQHILDLMESRVKVVTGALPTRADEIWELSGDNTAAREALGWAPRTNLEEGLRNTIAWVTQHQELARQLT